MRIVVTTPTGNIGKVVTNELLDAGAEVILPVRSPQKVKAFTDRGAKATKGTMDDSKFIAESCSGTDALFWLTPPDLGAGDYVASYRRMGESAAVAIKESGISRVVNLSSIGAHLADGTGPIAGLYPVEKLLEDAAPNVTHVRAAFFFENFLPHVESIKSAGSIFLPISGSKRLPMISTRDIGEAAARRLLDTSWSGRSTMGLHGPADLSFDEAAAAISEGLGREVKHVKVDEITVKQAMLGMGLGENITGLLLEMYRAIETELLKPEEPRTPETTTPTTLTAWAREVMRPMLNR